MASSTKKPIVIVAVDVKKINLLDTRRELADVEGPRGSEKPES